MEMQVAAQAPVGGGFHRNVVARSDRSSAVRYRAQAECLRELAEEAEFPDVRMHLVMLTVRYELMAEHAEKMAAGDAFPEN